MPTPRTNKELLQEVLSLQRDNKALITKLDVSHDTLKSSHYELRDTVIELDLTIRGTKAERESGKGGMAKQVEQNTECIRQIKKKQNRIYAWGSMLIIVLNTLFIGLLNFFKKG